jgi:drug/metabolite transporter (DMT)-like permease
MSGESRALSRATLSRATLSRATLYILFSACCFGSIPVLITIATRDGGVRLVDLLVWRYFIAALLLVVASGGLTPLRQPGRRSVPLLLLGGGGQAAIAFVSLSALRYIPAATLTFLFYTYPAWVAVMAALRGVERLTGRRLLALALSLTGIALMIGVPGAGGLNLSGTLLALSSALLYAAYIPLIDHLGRGVPPAVTSVFATAGAAVVLAGAAIARGGLALHFTPTGWTVIAILAFVCTVLAFIAFLRGLAAIGPVRTAIVSTIEPFWAALLGTAILGQQIGPRTLFGGLLIAVAVILLQLGQRSATTTTTPAPAA